MRSTGVFSVIWMRKDRLGDPWDSVQGFGISVKIERVTPCRRPVGAVIACPDYARPGHPAEHTSPFRNTNNLRPRQRLLQIGDDVVYVLDAYGKSYQAVGQAARLALRGRDLGVGHGRGVRDHGLDRAQALGQAA